MFICYSVMVLLLYIMMISCDVMAYQNAVYITKQDLTSACVHMIPNHKANLAQISEPPFTLRTIGDVYTPGMTLTVVINSKDDVLMNGFMLQARTANTTLLVGNFKIKRFTVKHNCNSPAVVTHRHTEWHTLPLRIPWTPPDGDVGPVQFVMTVVSSYQVFWTNVTTQTLNYHSAAGITISLNVMLLIISLLCGACSSTLMSL